MASETNSARLSVRPAGDGDLGPLTAALGSDVPESQVTRRLEESRLGHRDMLVAELDGSLGPSAWEDTAFRGRARCGLFALDVGAAIRRRGVGTALVKAVEAIASRRALDEVNLEVAIGNRDAIRLYERLGYRRHGDPVSDRWEPAARRRKQPDGRRALVGDDQQAGTSPGSHHLAQGDRSVPYLDATA